MKMNPSDLKILIVEDEVLIAMHLARELERAGYKTCRPAGNGAAAVAAAEKEGPNVVLMDIRLPGEMDGIEAGRKITDQHGIPVVFLTGYADSEVEVAAREISVAPVLGKPASVGEIEQAIHTVLAQTSESGSPTIT